MGEHKELEPCPWCGVVPALQWHTQEGEMGEGRYFYLVECGNGQCPMGLVSTGGPYRTAADAVKRWNSRASVAAPQGDEALLSSDIALKIARHITGKNADYWSYAEGLAELESIISTHFAAAAMGRVGQELIREFTQAAINAHIGFKHESRWHDCDYANCAKWREMIETSNAASSPAAPSPTPERKQSTEWIPERVWVSEAYRGITYKSNVYGYKCHRDDIEYVRPETLIAACANKVRALKQGKSVFAVEALESAAKELESSLLDAERDREYEPILTNCIHRIGMGGICNECSGVATSSPVSPSPTPEQKIDFSCRVCGVQCTVAPDPPAQAVCPEHCEDHDYEYMRGEGGHFCKHCGEQAPEDWYDD